MPGVKNLLVLAAILVVVCGFLSAVPAFAASKAKVLYSFCHSRTCTDGAGPRSGMISDAAGNLYGTTEYDGINYFGTVFKLAPGAGGKWTEQVLYSFDPNATDGFYPMAGLTLDGAGNLYGTASQGGNLKAFCNEGCGVVFQLTPEKNGRWIHKVLHRFNYTDGNIPFSSLVFDPAGNLYGTTYAGGKNNGGTVFELIPNSNGEWTEKVLYWFCHDHTCTDGVNPVGSVLFDSSGNLYGTTQGGGDVCFNCGTVFQLVPGADGKWTHKVLYSFGRGDGEDGTQPDAGLSFDAVGNLYGTTFSGGTHGFGCYGFGACGTVFELMPGGDGKWTERVLHSFGGRKDGAAPYTARLVFDKAGNLYGTTEVGGEFSACEFGCGTVFELKPDADGHWTESVLHSFDGADGSYPFAGLIFDTDGNLYGTSCCGGANNSGVVFEITP